jgi:hypothetical protein
MNLTEYLKIVRKRMLHNAPHSMRGRAVGETWGDQRKRWWFQCPSYKTR